MYSEQQPVWTPEEIAMMEAEAQWEIASELAAEAAAERWFEERGGNYRNQIEEDMEHSPFDPIWGL